jgi:short-subunit dehydrogenase
MKDSLMARRTVEGLRTIVTGATSGIGRSLVIELIRRDAKVVALGRRVRPLQELVHEVAVPNSYRYVVGDVTHQPDRMLAIETAHQEFGGLDCLINNAGIGALGDFAQADDERLRRVMEVNFFAPAEFIREALPLLKTGGQPIIVNIGSVLGHRAVPGKSEYCASKFALHGLSDALRAELAPQGIDVLLVSPSTTATEFFDVAAGETNQPHRASFGAMSAEAVARRTVNAIAAGRHEIILSMGGKLLVWLDRLCPPLADWLVARFR